jgi:hypothetical protein
MKSSGRFVILEYFEKAIGSVINIRLNVDNKI